MKMFTGSKGIKFYYLMEILVISTLVLDCHIITLILTDIIFFLTKNELSLISPLISITALFLFQHETDCSHLQNPL